MSLLDDILSLSQSPHALLEQGSIETSSWYPDLPPLVSRFACHTDAGPDHTQGRSRRFDGIRRASICPPDASSNLPLSVHAPSMARGPPTKQASMATLHTVKPKFKCFTLTRGAWSCLTDTLKGTPGAGDAQRLHTVGNILITLVCICANCLHELLFSEGE